MPVANDLAAADSLLKEYYTSDEVASEYQRKFPLLSRIDKKSFQGKYFVVPILTSDGAGVAADLTTANTTSKGVASLDFNIQAADLVGVVPLLSKTMKAAKGDKGSFVDMLKTEMDAKLLGMGRAHSVQLFGDGTGTVGVRASAAGNVITLSNPTDAVNFWRDMHIVATDAAGTTARTGSAVVTSKDPAAGTITVDNIAGIAAFANTDKIYIRGMSNPTLASNTTVMFGLERWITAANPTDTLWGVARTAFPELGGVRAPTSIQTGGPIERLQNLATHMWETWQSTPKCGVLHPRQWNKASLALQNQGYRPLTVGETRARAGYKALEITTEAGTVEVFSDPNCPLLTGWLLDLEYMWIHHYGESIIEIVKSPTGEYYVPATTYVGHEVRMESYPNLCMNAPWKHGRITLTAP